MLSTVRQHAAGPPHRARDGGRPARRRWSSPWSSTSACWACSSTTASSSSRSTRSCATSACRGRLPFVEIILPVGISFFTFQAISYVVDVYRRQPTPAPLLDFAVYLAFFPHLVAGPIVRDDRVPAAAARPPRLLTRREVSGPRCSSARGCSRRWSSPATSPPPSSTRSSPSPGQHSSLEILAGDLRLRGPDLRRLQRLHRHGDRHRAPARHRLPAELRPALQPPSRCRSSGDAGT